jgi:hypothetical protein
MSDPPVIMRGVLVDERGREPPVDHADVPDLTDAETYVGADRPTPGKRWHILADNTVLYERPSGAFPRSIIPARTLRSRPTWTRLQPDTDLAAQP